jgi:hypothetical protein
MNVPHEDRLKAVLNAYHKAFTSKDYGEENDDHDVLMDVFAVSPETKRENRQYWGRELGMCWQLLVSELFQLTTADWKVGYKEGKDELCDLCSGQDAIDTKYRIGSGDSGTLKKFKAYADRLIQLEYKPVLLILRTDNLQAAINACRGSKWIIYQGEQTFEYIRTRTNVDLKAWLLALGKEYHVDRDQLAQAAQQKLIE